jgi:DNA polymerase-1
VTQTTILIDGDILVYQALSATEKPTDWGDEIWTLHSNENEAKTRVLAKIEQFRKKLVADLVIMCLSDTTNFRKQIDPTYKENRKGTRKPLFFAGLREWLQADDNEIPDYMPFLKPGLEADDCMGILATQPRRNSETIIVSEDKDLRGIPGLMFHKGQLSEISDQEADDWFYTQVLTGDPVDGYKGCPGIGPKKAEGILKKGGSKWVNIEKAFEAAGLTKEDALVQARLARILRWSDWDSEKGEPILWTPS